MTRADQTLDRNQIKYETIGVRNNILGNDDYLLANFLLGTGLQDLLHVKQKTHTYIIACAHTIIKISVVSRADQLKDIYGAHTAGTIP